MAYEECNYDAHLQVCKFEEISPEFPRPAPTESHGGAEVTGGGGGGGGLCFGGPRSGGPVGASACSLWASPTLRLQSCCFHSVREFLTRHVSGEGKERKTKQPNHFQNTLAISK